MPNPQPPDLETNAPTGPVPPENQAGHHPEREQDKPDLDAFAARLGIGDEPTAGTAPGRTGTLGREAKARSGVFAGVAAALAIVILVVARIKKRRR
ncbi:MAG: hypothetical protein ABR540_20355 [Acidimicrobiales bacterium]|nr:hypothetical protein [Actinomycetota bacterium]